MSTTALLWSVRSAGWLATTGNYTSDINEARRFELSEALAMVRKHKTEAGHNMIPVRLDDMEAAK